MISKEPKKQIYYNKWYVICLVIIASFSTYMATSYFEYHQIANSSNFYSAGSNLGTMRTILTKEGHCAWGTYGNGDPKNCITAGQYLDWCISLWTENNTGDPLSWCSNLMIKGNNGTSYASQPIQKLPVIGLMVFQPHYVLLSDNICRGKGVMINQTGEISCQDNHEILGVMPWIK